MVKPANAQTIPKPSVPDFTLKLVDYCVQMDIRNQPIIPNGHDTAGIFYSIRVKSHYSDNWVSTTVPNPSQGIRGYIGEIGTTGYTTLQKDFNSIKLLLGLSGDSHQIDYQVEAINGYLNTTVSYLPPFGFDPNSTPVVIVNTSGWSNTETITIPTSSSLSTLTPFPTPSISTAPTSTQTITPTMPASSYPSISFLLTLNTISLIVIAVLLAVIIALLLLIRHRTTAKSS